MNALRVLVLLTALTLAGCQVSRTAQADPTEYGLGEVFTVGGGQEAVVRGEDLRIRFAQVLEDSRCPKQVECFWTGQARIAVVVQPAGAPPTTVVFNTNPAPGQNVQSAQVSAYTVDLSELDPYPQTPGPIDLEDYRATMTVRKS